MEMWQHILLIISLILTLSLPGRAEEKAGAMMASITGPIAVTAESGEPFRGANEQPVPGPGLPIPVLVPYGYVEEEYFISGTVDGKPYSTNLLVRKPKDPSKFSGLVAVETVHLAGAIPFWGFQKVWLNSGHGWVAVASQKGALEEHVKKSNPKRYGSLQIPAVGDPDASPMRAMRGGPQDDVSQAIMTHVGALLKSNSNEGPFQGMTVKYLVMGGASQTGGTTLRYIQNSHEQARMPDGKPIYDGYAPLMAFSAEPPSAKGAAIVHPVSEGDLMSFAAFGRPMVFREDSDAPDDRYRHYQIAGASHVGTRGISDPLEVFGTLDNVLKEGEKLSQFPQAALFVPTVFNLVNWIMKSIAPPRGQLIEVANGKIVRDEYGNAKGGVRSPYIDLPTVRYIASAPADMSNMFRRLIGLQEPIPADKLRGMHTSREAYLEKFNRQIDRMVEERWLFADEGDTLKAEEAERPLF